MTEDEMAEHHQLNGHGDATRSIGCDGQETWA